MFGVKGIVLLVGDLLTITLFVLIGRDSHSMTSGWEGFLAALKTAGPFMLGWLVSAIALGGYRAAAWAGARAASLTLLKCYIPALILGSLLRALLLGRFSPPMFYVVTAVILFVMLFIWRLLFTFVLAPRLRA
ncbi:MAG: DUF3054 domain-containing protein [Caldilineales bacterium]|nr:DUF3054 domain-containing protein [Caldilineales bacterium]